MNAALTPHEIRALRAVAGLMIPASVAHGVPGADDEAIVADMAATVDRDLAGVRAVLAWLDAAAGGDFAGGAGSVRLEACERMRREAPEHAAVLVAVVTRCYYRDDRVVRSLGLPVRAPFPLGFEVAQGDYSLTDPVRARGRIWREA